MEIDMIGIGISLFITFASILLFATDKRAPVVYRLIAIVFVISAYPEMRRICMIGTKMLIE